MGITEIGGDRMKKIMYIIFITSFLSLSVNGALITRDGVISPISTASLYVPISSWTPVVDSTNKVSPTWHSWYKTKKNGGNPPYDKLAYCWSGFDTPSGFISRVENKTSPVPAGGYNTSQYSYPRPYIAGIDCSGFVLRCWGISTYTTYQQLIDYSLKIDKSKLKKGDLLRKSGHSVLYVSGTFPGKCDIYESQADPSTGAHFPGVVSHSRVLSEKDYTPYSIFPQFSSPDISYNKDTMNISVDIAVNARYGRVHKDSVKVRVDGKEINDFTFKSLGNGRYKVKSSKGFVLSRDHILEIRADNEELRNRYRDTESQLQIITIE